MSFHNGLQYNFEPFHDEEVPGIQQHNSESNDPVRNMVGEVNGKHYGIIQVALAAVQVVTLISLDIYKNHHHPVTPRKGHDTSKAYM
jgi:hypothetical protein